MVKIPVTASVFLLSLFIPILNASSVRAEVEEDSLLPPAVIIQEIKLGGDPEPREYVTLYNAGEVAVPLDGWALEYAKSSFDKELCDAPDWRAVSEGSIARQRTLPDVILSVGSSIAFPFSGFLNDNTEASLRLLQSNDEQVIVHDLVGWGENAACFDDVPAVLPLKGESIHRFFDCEGEYLIDTDSNDSDFYLNKQPGILDPETAYLPECYISDEENIGQPEADVSVEMCDQLLLSELLPNPQGLDTGREFIELFNPTDEAVPLAGCRLLVNSNSSNNTKEYIFAEDDVLEANSYRAFYSSETGLTLVNAAGGTVTLLGPEYELAVEYPPQMKDDHAWALFDDKWACDQHTLTGCGK